MKSQKRLFTQASQCLQSIAPATQNEPDASKVLRLPHRIIIMSEIKFDNGFTKFSTDLKCRPSSPNTAHATKNSTSQFEQCTESATPAVRMKKCPMSCACHAKQCFTLQNARKAPRLPRKMDIAQKRGRRASKTRSSEERSPRPGLREDAQSKCTWTSRKGTFVL